MFSRFFRTTATLATLAAVAACGTPRAGGGSAYLRIAENGQTILGQYDPADYRTGQMRFLLTGLCNNPGLASYGEAPSDGLVAFTANCAGGTYGTPGAGGRFHKTSPDRVQMNFTFRDATTDGLVQRVTQFQLTPNGGRKLNSEDIAL